MSVEDKVAVSDECCARIGLLGNPSDGFHGKTISCLFRNFSAVVTMEPHGSVELVPNPEHDLNHFESLRDLYEHTTIKGYYGGLRLILATCKTFARLCKAAGLPDARTAGGFRISYSTNIPRMVGLSGSSAIVTATFRCLLKYYQISLERDLRVAKHDLPGIILSVEKHELGISAGLQDRVIQCYGGLVHMDFSIDGEAATGEGSVPIDRRYSELSTDLLPKMYLVYNTNAASDSGGVHSTVRQRWEARDPELLAGMRQLAGIADQGLKALRKGDFLALGDLMDANFATRRRLYGDAVVGAVNIAAVELARRLGFSAKFTGSGGAIVCVHREQSTDWLPEDREEEIRAEFEALKFAFIRVII